MGNENSEVTEESCICEDKCTCRSDRSSVITGLIINLFVPGLGTLFMCRVTSGLIQLILTIVGGAAFWWGILGYTLAPWGAVLAVIIWIWALVTGIKALKK